MVLVAMVLGGVGTWEATLAEGVSFVCDKDFVVSLLSELLGKLGVISLDVGVKVSSNSDGLASGDRDVSVLVTPGNAANSFAEPAGWVVIFVVASSVSIPAMWVAVTLS